MQHFSPWTKKTVEQSLLDLKSSKQGLSAKEISLRLATYGPNKVQIKEDTALSIFIRQFTSPFNYLLFIAASIALIIGEWVNGLMMILLSLLNVTIGFFQEYKAFRTMIKLRTFIPSTTRVIRDGHVVNVNKELIVPGDIIILYPGKIIPADVRIIDETFIVVDESTLTGESAAVTKVSQPSISEVAEIFNANNIAFAGTSVISGQCKGLVIATGQSTVFSSITKGQVVERISAFEKSLVNLSHMIVRFVVATVSVLFIVKIFLGSPIHPLDLLIFFMTLIIAIVPEALPAVVTFALAQGALRLAKNSVVVKRLSSIDDLGDIEILCVDKTGTLTELRLAVDEIVSHDKERFLLYALMDTIVQANELTGKSAFDEVLLSYASDDIKGQLKKYQALYFIPFDSFRMRTTILVKDPHDNHYIFVLGAPEIILERCSTVEDGKTLEQMLADCKKRGLEGKRTLGVAYKKVPNNMTALAKEDDHDLTFMGFVSLINPIKKGVEKTISLAHKLGVTIKMITGDSKEVAGYVAHHIGLIDDPQQVILGKELQGLSDADFFQQCHSNKVFARIDPETKARLIECLQKKYEVGFLGEGINDVPALKKANVALVVQEASDIARSCADIILLRRDLHVIVSGIRQGRVTFSNISKYIRCTLAGNFGNYYSLALFALIIPFLPILPTQILLINLLSDLPLIAIASDRVDEEQLKRPKGYDLTKVLFLLLFLGFVGTLSDMIFFAMFYKTPPEMFRSLWFVLNILSDVVLIFSIRTTKCMFCGTRPSALLVTMVLLIGMIGFSLPYTNIGHSWFELVAPSLMDILKVCAIVIVYGVMTEFVKLNYWKYTKNNNMANV